MLPTLHGLPSRSAIRRLRLPAPAGTDTLGLRRRTERTLAGVDLDPPGFPASAWLLIRNLAVEEGARGWASELRAGADAAARSAARPDRGRLRADAPAVLFADEAEALAVFALAILERRAEHEWWWPVLWGRTLEPDWIESWCERPESIPRAAWLLAEWNCLELAAGAAGETGGLRLFETLVRTFALTHLAELPQIVRHAIALARDFHDPDKSAIDPRVAGQPRREPAVAGIAGSPRPTGSLDPEVRAWATVALELTASPAAVRSRPFADRLARQIAAAWDPTVPNPPPAAAPISGLSESPGPPAERGRRFAPSARSQRESPASGTEDPAAPPATGSVPETVVDCDRAVPGRDAAVSPELPDLPGPAVEESIATEFGGILYLVNVAIALELYGDFTSPAAPGLDLPLWDFLALFGPRFAGPGFDADPLCRSLARLAARPPRNPPGLGFNPPGGQPFPAWLAETDWRMRQRLGAALGEQDPAELCSLVFARRARVEVTGTRVDAHFLLAEHPIELRLAGLDRDPGWVPAGGRAIAFHYD